MERGNTKHSGRLDDEMRHETDPLTRGAPGEARVEEHLEKESPADGEPVPQEVLRTAGRETTEER
jgi:hypothetical protein